MTEDKKLFKTLWELYWVFFKIGAVTFGGGMAMLPILERELKEKRGWTTTEDLLDYYAIGQSTPGIIAVNVATFLGYKRTGIIGGIVATAAVISPSIIVITIIAKFISNFNQIIWVQKALSGINVSVAALLTYSVYNFGKKVVKDFPSAILMLAAFAAMFFFNVNTIFVIVGAIFIGILLAAKNGELTVKDREGK